MSFDSMPTYRQILELPTLHEGLVLAEYIDVNGHMNIRHYLDHGAMGADVIVRRAGIDDEYRAQRRMGVFTAEHHIRYFSEMHEGDEFSVHARFLDRSDRVSHLLTFLLDRTDGTLACTVEIVFVHVDMDTRRPVPYPPDIAAELDGWIEESRLVPWSAPVSGVMGIRR